MFGPHAGRVRVRCSEIYFYRFSSGSGLTFYKNCGSGLLKSNFKDSVSVWAQENNRLIPVFGSMPCLIGYYTTSKLLALKNLLVCYFSVKVSVCSQPY